MKEEFTMLSYAYNKMVEDGRMDKEKADPVIRIADFFAESSQDDFYRMVDMSAFNGIMECYFRAAMENCRLDKGTVDVVINEFKRLLDENTAREICDGKGK